MVVKIATPEHKIKPTLMARSTWLRARYCWLIFSLPKPIPIKQHKLQQQIWQKSQWFEILQTVEQQLIRRLLVCRLPQNLKQLIEHDQPIHFYPLHQEKHLQTPEYY